MSLINSYLHRHNFTCQRNHSVDENYQRSPLVEASNGLHFFELILSELIRTASAVSNEFKAILLPFGKKFDSCCLNWMAPTPNQLCFSCHSHRKKFNYCTEQISIAWWTTQHLDQSFFSGLSLLSKNLHRLLLDYYSIQFKHRFNPIEFEWTDSFVLIDLQVFALPSELLHRMHVTVVRMRVTIVHPMEKWICT